MFEYTFPAKDGLHIDTPKVKDFSEVKVIKNEVTSTSSHTIYEYPNGVIFEVSCCIDKCIVKCNHEIIHNGDGTYHIS